MSGGAAAIAATPQPPYYAVIFTSLRTDGDNGYAAMAERMVDATQGMPGFLGIESVRETLGITVCYWRDLASIAAWKAHVEHIAAQKRGAEEWYSAHRVRICRVEREYGT